jgi:hypothetical protein
VALDRALRVPEGEVAIDVAREGYVDEQFDAHRTRRVDEVALPAFVDGLDGIAGLTRHHD